MHDQFRQLNKAVSFAKRRILLALEQASLGFAFNSRRLSAIEVAAGAAKLLDDQRARQKTLL